MYYQKLTKKEKEDKLYKLNLARQKLEKHPVIIAWKNFLKLPSAEKSRIWTAWDKYYAEAKDSPIAQLFYAQKQALSEGNLVRVKDLAAQAKEMRLNGDNITLTKPQGYDPAEFEHGIHVQTYKNLIRSIQDLSSFTPTLEADMEGKETFA